MTDRIRAVILCEDRQQEVFARTFLEAVGITPFRILIGPPGKGAGEQYVRKNYPQNVQTFRSKFPAQPNTCLVVMTDSDVLETIQRLEILDKELQQSGLPKREPKERIGIFIPKRNIETWIHFLMGETVNEEDEYQKLKKESICKPFVEDLARNRRNPLPDDAPPSVCAACNELDRIL